MARAADETTAAPALPAHPARAAERAEAPQAERPRAVPVGAAHAASSDEGMPNQNKDAAPAKFSATDKWVLAGYNNNEIVYTIIVSNDDTRILHCTTLMQGWYVENGKKLPISDRQSATVFPDQPAQIGNWMDMDRQSGATFTVRCRPI
jgi:hypothetical protein